MRLAYEMIPFLPKQVNGRPTQVTTAEGDPVTSEGATTSKVRIDRGGFGVDIIFEKPQAVKRGQNDTVMIAIVEPAPKPTPAERIGIKYKLLPFAARRRPRRRRSPRRGRGKHRQNRRRRRRRWARKSRGGIHRWKKPVTRR
jgi:hypothetical protein